MCHAALCQVALFSDAILWGRVRYRFFVQDTVVFAVCEHLAEDKFKGVIDTKNFDCFVAEVFGGCFELDKERKSFITGFHKEQGNKTRITVNEENVV